MSKSSKSDDVVSSNVGSNVASSHVDSNVASNVASIVSGNVASSIIATSHISESHKSSGFISKPTTFMSGVSDSTGGASTPMTVRRSSNTSNTSLHAGAPTPPSPQSTKSSPQSHPRYISKNVFMAAAAGTLDVSAHDFDDLCLCGSLNLKDSTTTLTPQSSPHQLQQSVNPSSLFAHQISRSASSSSVSSAAAMASTGKSISITSASTPINSNSNSNINSAMSADTLVAEEINKNKWRNR